MATATPEALLKIDAQEFAEMLANFMVNGKTLGELKGLTRDNMEAVYSVAYNAYNSGRYKKAHQAFQFLCYFDHLEQKNWMGLGACRQMLKEYPDAVEAYTFAGLLDADDPHPPLQAADCHIAMGNRDAAISGLSTAIEWSGDKPEYQAVKARAEALLDLLKESAGSDQGGKK